MRAFVYLRQSLDRSGEGAAVERQRVDCEKLCTERGWSLAETFVDNDTSASTKKPRPAYTRMLNAIENGEADIIVAWHVDRLTRKLTDLEHLIVLAERTGVRVATVTGDLDLSTDGGRLVGRILASVARGEVERKGARQKRAQQQAAELGKPMGGRRAFGYERDGMTICATEADLVREAFAHVLEGGSLRGLATDWNTRGLQTTAGNAWIPSSVRYMLRNPRYAGRRTYRGQTVGPGLWPALVGDETFDAVHAILTLPERKASPTSTARRYLLPGLARCFCGSTVKTGRTQHGVRTYRCVRLQGHLSRAAEPIDELVRAIVVGRLSQGDARDLLDQAKAPDIALAREKMRRIDQRIDDLATALAEGILTLSAVRNSSDRLRGERTTIEAEVATLSRGDVLAPLVNAPDPAKAWEMAGLDSRRSVIDVLMSVTLLKPLRGRQAFDPQTVQIEWKGQG